MTVKILYYTVWLVTRAITLVFFRIRIGGSEHIPKAGGFIIASNHVSYYDPPLIGSWVWRPVFFVAKQELFANPVFGRILRGINALPVKRGVIDRNAINLAAAVVERGGGLVVFPEGTRSKTDAFLEPKPGIGIIALRVKCPIVPCYLHGTNRLKRCLFGRDRLSITFGQPIPPERYAMLPAEKDSYQRVAQLVMDEIRTLRGAVTGLK